jgi:ribonuclease HI
MKEITMFTDGSSMGNPGPGGWAAVVFDPGTKQVTELGGHHPKTTNNRMEMMAAIEALTFLNISSDDETALTVYTDSQYLINGITKWVFGWEKSGWVTANKKSVLNKDLWQLLVAKVRSLDIEWKYVEGHSGIPGNERVDAIATGFAAGKPPKLFSGKFSDYSIDLKNLAPSYAPSAKEMVRNGKVYSYLSMVDGEIKSHKTWKECEARVKGKKARFKKTFSKLDEEQVIKSQL